MEIIKRIRKKLKIFININILRIEFKFKLICDFKLNKVNKLKALFFINNIISIEGVISTK